MSRDDEAGAVAAATYFLTELYPYTLSSQDTATWREMSHPDCLFCQSVIDDAAALRLSERVTVVAPIGIESMSTQTLSPLAFSMTLEITTGPDEDFTKDGAFLEKSTEVAGTAIIIVVRQGTAWLTRGVDLKERG